LNPTYNLAQVEQRPVTPTKFRRDGMAIDDIQGTRAQKTWKGSAEKPREVNQIDDIAGTRSI
jgi:hypothetical protein